MEDKRARSLSFPYLQYQSLPKFSCYLLTTDVYRLYHFPSPLTWVQNIIFSLLDKVSFSSSPHRPPHTLGPHSLNLFPSPKQAWLWLSLGSLVCTLFCPGHSSADRSGTHPLTPISVGVPPIGSHNTLRLCLLTVSPVDFRSIYCPHKRSVQKIC